MGSGLWSLNPGKSCYEMKEKDWLCLVEKIQVVKFLAKRMDENIEREASLNSIINVLSMYYTIMTLLSTWSQTRS